MLQYLIKVTDNTFIPIIIFAMLCAILTLMHVRQKRRIVSFGIIVGVVIAAFYTYLKLTTGYAVREFYDLTILIPLVISSLLLIACFWLQNYRQCTIVYRVCCLLNFIVISLIVAQFLPNLFLYPFEFNVGMDSIFNNDYLYKCIGYWLAIVVILMMGLLVFYACQRFTPLVSLTIITLSFIVYSFANVVNILQILIVRRFITPPKWITHWIIYILSHVNLFHFIFLSIITLLALMLLIKAQTTSLMASNPAQIRKIKAQIRQDKRRSLLLIAGSAITLYTITRARTILETGAKLSPAEPVMVDVNGLIVISLDAVNDGNLHRYGYTASDGTLVRFIVIKKSDNAYGVGFDACDICGASGYYQRGNQIVCILCDVVMNIATIGFAGGCNPVPLKYQIIDGKMVIRPADLETEKNRFK